jgi:Uma2 family endonuclease
VRLITFFLSRFRESGIGALPEWRFQVKPTRFRIPDIVVTLGKPDEQILTRPPLLCIEILSPEDTVTRTNQRIREYLDFGVPAVWLVDPAEKTVTVYRSNNVEIVREGSVRVDGTSLDVPFSAIFD